MKTYLKSRRSSVWWTRMKMWRTGRSIILIVGSVQNFFMRGSMSAIRRHAKLHFSAFFRLILESDSRHVFRVYFPFYSSSFRSRLRLFDWLAYVPNNGFSESLYCTRLWSSKTVLSTEFNSHKTIDSFILDFWMINFNLRRLSLTADYFPRGSLEISRLQ